jgi:hypothetical protein
MNGTSAPVAAGLAAGIGFFVLLAVVVNTSISPSVPQELLQERSGIASMLAVSEARKLVGNASAVEGISYRWLAFDKDQVTLSTTGSVSYKPVHTIATGTFIDSHCIPFYVPIDIRLLENAVGYTMTESGNNIIKIDIDRNTNAILATEVEPLPDRTVQIKFAEDHKKAIELALSDGRIKELGSKHPYFIALMREVGSSECKSTEGCILVGLGLLSEPHSGTHTGVIVDVTAGEVISVDPPLTEP